MNNDLTPDGLDNHLPHSVEVDTPPSAVVTYRSVPAGVRRRRPAAAAPRPAAARRRGHRGADDLRADADQEEVRGRQWDDLQAAACPSAVGAVVITQPTRGRKVGGSAGPTTRKNRRKKACTFQKAVTTIVGDQAAGNVSIPFSGKVGKRKLRPGRYTATFIVTDAAGNVSKAASLVFKIVRR